MMGKTSWKVLKLKYLIDLRSGDAIPGEEIKDIGEYPVFGGNGLRGFTDQYNQEGKRVLIGRQGALCGNVNYADGRFWATEHAIVATPKVELDSSWLGETLKVMNLNQYSQSAAQPGIAVEVIANLDLSVPPIEEQRAISGFIDLKTAPIDRLIAEKQKLLGTLSEKRRALINHAITQGLDPNVPMKDSGIPWLGKIPAHWKATKMGRLFRQVKRLGFPDLTVLSVYREYGVIERATRDDNANKVPEDLEKYQLVEIGDLVVNKMKAWQGSLGISDFLGITSPDYVVFQPGHKEFPAFMHYRLRASLMTSVYLSISNGIRTSQWRIEPDRFLDLPIFLPDIAEQKLIVEHIQVEIAKLDNLAEATRKTIALLQERRSALISAAVTGQMEVS